MIRTATDADIPALLDMATEFHAASSLPFGFDRDAMGRTMAAMIEADTAAILMTDRGFIGGILAPAYCDPAWMVAVEMFWWSKGDGMPLLRAFEAWAAGAGANEIRMSTIAALPRADAILRRKGYRPTEISYGKVI